MIPTSFIGSQIFGYNVQNGNLQVPSALFSPTVTTPAPEGGGGSIYRLGGVSDSYAFSGVGSLLAETVGNANSSLNSNGNWYFVNNNFQFVAIGSSGTSSSTQIRDVYLSSTNSGNFQLVTNETTGSPMYTIRPDAAFTEWVFFYGTTYNIETQIDLSANCAVTSKLSVNSPTFIAWGNIEYILDSV
ncbi:hypothetical protein Thermo_01110 [Thermoplasmatales archaeon]|nr:hypothetical protein Thermo_01110 [Thermoplasmatales archaeon]